MESQVFINIINISLNSFEKNKALCFLNNKQTNKQKPGKQALRSSPQCEHAGIPYVHQF